MLAILIPVAFDTSCIPEVMVMVMVMPSNQIIMKLEEIAKIVRVRIVVRIGYRYGYGYSYGYGCGHVAV